MKNVSNNRIAVFAGFVVLLTLFVNSYAVTRIGITTGAAVVNQGMVSICLNRPPYINYSCSGNAVVGQQYICDLDAYLNPGEYVNFSDDTGLFEINRTTGLINFTPDTGDLGFHVINITAVENSSCSNNINSTIFTLNITSEELLVTYLNITKEGGHGAMLNWTNITWAENYTVYYSDNISVMRNLVYNDMTAVEGIETLFWNDTSAHNATRRYYRIMAVNTTEKISAETVGKFDLRFIANADGSLGRNLFSIPFNKTYYANPFLHDSLLCNYSATLTRLNRDDENYENYESHSCSSGAYNNYSMGLGDGFFMYLNTTYNYTVVGPVSDQNLTLIFVSNVDGSLGRNLFGLHLPQETQYADPFLIESTLCSYSATLTRLNRYDENYENYESHSCSSGSYNNYSMLPGYGFFMYVDTTESVEIP
ncbi:MAG: hypothetical protein KKE20_02525 [Nanoarchaeota archaeon]|nr:hypothetical protein [Nanoarchaeota archaeon]